MSSSIFSSCSAVGCGRPAQEAVIAETGLADDKRRHVGRHRQIAAAWTGPPAPAADLVRSEDHLFGCAAGEHGLEFFEHHAGASAPGCWPAPRR